MTVATEPPASTDVPEPSPDERPVPRSRATVVPWVVAVVALAVAAFSTARWLDLQAQADAREDVVVAASAFLTDLINWDAADGLDDTVTSLREQGTGRFLAQVDDLFGGAIGDELEVAEAASEGAVEELFVQSLDDGRAEVFAIVTQSVRSTLADTPGPAVRQVIMQLEHVDGAWRIENLELPQLIQRAPTGEGQG